jgi:hypothetical protein
MQMFHLKEEIKHQKMLAKKGRPQAAETLSKLVAKQLRAKRNPNQSIDL